ncbi:MAG: ATP-grasp domain-containing protein, partial [Bdellovibrionales bacterium]|nr:ATP-grasp domain-containing protein [Bdellovibrionales bacterium]
MKQAIGILGGGQLARMLVDSAQRLGLPYLVYAQSPSDSVTHVTKNVVFGALDDKKSLSQFFDSVQIVTTENEFLDVELMRAAACGKNIEFRPSLDSIRTAQDKLAQKKLFLSLDLPTSRFLVWDDSATSPRAFCEEVLESFPMGAMLKWSRFGYDGKGNLPFRPSSDASFAEPFLREGLIRGAQIYAEEWVQFENELALVTTSSPSGELRYFPTVISEQR